MEAQPKRTVMVKLPNSAKIHALLIQLACHQHHMEATFTIDGVEYDTRKPITGINEWREMEVDENGYMHTGAGFLDNKKWI